MERTKSPPQLKLGDVVVLKSGGPQMTVEAIEANAKRFRDLLELLIPKMKESHQSAKKLCKESAYKQFGLADASINEAGQSRLILTDDLPLLSFIENTGGNVLNFTNLRPLILPMSEYVP